MAQNSENKNTLKNLPSYSEEIESVKEKNEKNNNSKIFTKKTKELSNKELSDILPFPPKGKKDLKD